MKFNKIVLMDFKEESIDKEHFDKLKELSNQLELVNDRNLEKIKDADVLLTRITTKVDKELIDNCPNLKYIGVFATSFSAIDIEYAKQKGIIVTNLAGYSTEAVAEFVFAALLENIRELERAKENAREGNFNFQEFLGYELKEKSFGIIGLGNIGKRVADIALSLGMKVNYYSRNRKQDYETKGVKYFPIEEIMKSDIITIHLAHNSKTEGFIDKEELDLIKKDAILITLTSLELTDLDYLIELLKQNKFILITDYLDMLSEEKRREIQGLKNVIAYPPIAFRTKEAIQRQKNLLIDNLIKFSQGIEQNRIN